MQLLSSRMKEAVSRAQMLCLEATLHAIHHLWRRYGLLTLSTSRTQQVLHGVMRQVVSQKAHGAHRAVLVELEESSRVKLQTLHNCRVGRRARSLIVAGAQTRMG